MKEKIIKKRCFYSCIPIISSDEETLIADLKAVENMNCDFIEWRRDHFEKGRSLSLEKEISLLRKIEKSIGGKGILYTYRSNLEGGVYETKDQTRLRGIEAAVKSEVVDYIDVELRSEKSFMYQVKSTLSDQKKAKLILSYHDFLKTPQNREIEKIFEEMLSQDPAVLKLAVMPKEKDEVNRLIEIALNFSKDLEIPMIVIAMGSLGTLSRVIPEFLGGTMTYLGGKGKTAPGQLDLQEINFLREKLGVK